MVKIKALIVEDDFVSRRLLQRFLEPYGTCDIAADGNEAVKAFHLAWEEQEPYDLICLDIMLPGIDGHAVLKEIRDFEKERGISGRKGVKIMMTTVLKDEYNVKKAFKSACSYYLAKPIVKEYFFDKLKAAGLLPADE